MEEVMEENNISESVFSNKSLVVIPVAIGLFSMLINLLFGHPILEPLLIAFVIGVFVNSFLSLDKEKTLCCFRLAYKWLIPIGAGFYGAVHLNFFEFAHVDRFTLYLLLLVFVTVVGVSLFLSHIFGLRNKTGYLVATGSSVCGASAIAVTTPSIEAEAEDVSNSLVSVFIAALIGLFVVLPLLRFQLGLDEQLYAILCASVLQFTGLVKVAVANMPAEIIDLALSIKSARYLWLLIIIPFLSSRVKNKLYIPFYIILFLGAGLLFSFLRDVQFLMPALDIILILLWSVAMAAIGLNTNLKSLFSKDSLLSFLVAFISFIAAVGIFLVVYNFLS